MEAQNLRDNIDMGNFDTKNNKSWSVNYNTIAKTSKVICGGVAKVGYFPPDAAGPVAAHAATDALVKSEFCSKHIFTRLSLTNSVK